MSDNKEFRDQYKITKDNIQSLQKSANDSVKKFISELIPFNIPEVRTYLHNVVAAIMLEHEKYYEGFDITIPYRFKSEKSKFNKTIDFFSNEGEFTYDEETDNFSFNFQREILDTFGMKIIAANKRPTFNSSDPILNELIKEKKENHTFLGKMQGFKFKLINSEFEHPPKYKYMVSKKDYYENCKSILQRIKTLIAPEATDLYEKYDAQINSIEETTNLLNNMGVLNDTISENDFKPNSDINFLDILDDFSLRVHDKLDLAALTKQILSINGSELLNKLGVEILPKVKEKRTKAGYVANFIYIKTLVGKIECQLQSEHEYKEGNYGYASHNKINGKEVSVAKIPDMEDENDIEEFYNFVRYITPDSYLAQLDNLEENRVLIHEGSEYQNYKNVTSQFPKNTKQYQYLRDYFKNIYQNREKLFKYNGSEMGIMNSDILSYINSEEYKNLPDIINKAKSNDISR